MRSRLAVLVVGLAVGAAGCTLVGRPEAPSPGTSASPATPSGTSTGQASGEETYGGQVDLEGQTLTLVLQLSRRGSGQVDAEVRIEALNLTAKGGGTWKEGTLDLRLSYPGSCSGTMNIQAHQGEREGTLLGSLEASDCTGTERGTLRLLRRSSAAPR